MIFADLLMKTQGATGTKRPILMISPEKFETFFDRLKDSDIELEMKALLGVACSAGLRITEALKVTNEDVEITTGRFVAKALKKREFVKSKNGGQIPVHPVLRRCVLHPAALKILRHHCNVAQRFQGRIFKMSRFAAYRQIIKIFGKGASPHTIARHSFISWLIWKGHEPLYVAKRASVTLKTIEHYYHIDEDRENDELFKESA